MKTEVKEITQCIRELTVTIEATEASTSYNAILNKVKKQVAIPGFRKGKAPNTLIEKHYHDYIKEEFLNEKVGEYYKSALDELDISPINQGEATDVKWEKGTDLIATYRFEIFPEVELKQYKDLEIPFEPIEFKKEMIEESINDFRNKMAEEIDSESVPEKGDILNVTVNFLDEEGNPTKEIERTFNFSDNQYSKQFNNNIAKLKVGDEVKTKLFTQKQKSDDKEIDDSIKNNLFLVKVNSIKHKVLPEVNEDFAKDLEYANVAEMNKKIEEDLKKNIQTQNENRKRESIMAQLIEKNPFELPQSVVKQYAESMAKPAAEAYKIDLEQVIPMYTHMAEFNLKTHYIMEKVKKNIEINISDEEKEEAIKEAALKLKMDIDKYKKLYKKQIEEPDFLYAIEERKALEYLEKNSKIVPYPQPEENKSEKTKEDKS